MEIDKDLIQAFSKLIDNPAMLAIKEKLNSMLDTIPKSPGYYASNPDHAHMYNGYEMAIEEINNFIFIHMEYALKDKEEQGNEG